MRKDVCDSELEIRWEVLVNRLSSQFSEGESITIAGVLYLVGLQELGSFHQKFKKDDNVNLIHIGICSVLEPFGYYQFEYFDNEGWPHFKLVEPLPFLKPGEQDLLIKKGLVEYFLKRGIIQ